MVKKTRNFASVFLVFIIIASTMGFISASFSLGNASDSIETIYGPSAEIQGWINLSFTNANSDSLLEDTEGNSISLLDFLKLETGYQYTCQPTDCLEDYSSVDSATSNTFSIGPGESKILGLQFTGNLVGINSASFTLQSNAAASCQNQLKLDLFDNGETNFINNKASLGASCSETRDYGCYSSSSPNEEYIVSDLPYCQKINLSESPGFTVGAWVKKVSGSRTLKMYLYDKEGYEAGNCVLPEASLSGGEISCDVSYPAPKEDSYYACISSSSGSGEYRIRGNTNPSEGCGFFGVPPPSVSPAAYQIFAQGKQFASPGTLQVPNLFPDGEVFAAMIEDYISGKYGNFDCTGGCIIPLKVESGASQQITINNVSINYEKDTGVVTDNKVYELEKIPAKIDSGFQQLYLDNAGFKVPDSIGSYTFTLDLDNDDILSKNLEIKEVPEISSLSPLVTAAAYPTNFVLEASAANNISKIFWDFGDNDTAATTNNSVSHTYSSLGNYTLMVTVTDNKDLSSIKIFNIEVESPKSLIGSRINVLKKNIENVGNQTSGLSLFAQSSIDTALDTVNVKQNLDTVEQSFINTVSESEYAQLIGTVLAIDYPSSITEGNAAEALTFFPAAEDIKPSALESLSQGYDSSKDQNYAYAITAWNNENLQTSLDFEEYLGTYEDAQKIVSRVFTMNIQEKADVPGEYYLFLPQLENLKFGQGFTPIDAGDYVYVEVKGKSSVSFSTTSDVDFTNLPAFISPAISGLTVTDDKIDTSPPSKPKATILVLALIVLAIVAVFAYIVLQQWYKRKYESHLFKNRNDLYNMVNYVNSARKRGLKDKEIETNLKKAKWSGEQITYVMKKYAGRRTGMFELPVDRAMKFFKLKENEEK